MQEAMAAWRPVCAYGADLRRGASRTRACLAALHMPSPTLIPVHPGATPRPAIEDRP